ncbi:MAG: hypothetical protein OYH77_00435 [Pseudomonadota bacterium]|nr:hypothetical protein [Pseudomonadota bacterium]
MRLTHTTGVTITSVLVATALAGIVSAVVAQLLTNQSKVMRTLSLRAERENLLKHYRDTLISGWDQTLTAGCSSGIHDRAGNVKVPPSGLTVKSDDLYSSSSVSDGWWKVSFDCGATAGTMFASDKYETTHGSGMHSETHHKVTLKVEFLKDEHPHINTALRTRQETFYMHQQKRLATDTDCRIESNRTRENYYKPDVDQARALGLITGDKYSLYKGEGAVIQYDFNTNYTKCSQVPLVRRGSCAPDAAIIGFWGTMEAGSGFPYVYGQYVCSHDGGTGMPTPDPVSGIRYHPKVDSKLPSRYITVYRGKDGSDDRHLGHFGADGCQKDSRALNHTYVSFLDEKGTAYCQQSRHVVENNVSCNTYPHAGVPNTAYNSSYGEPDRIVDSWGDDTEESSYERYVRDAIAAATARGHTAPAIPSDYFSRTERDTGWVLGRGGFLEFAGFDYSGKEPGVLVSKTENPDCSEPGYEKGAAGEQGDPGGNGSKKGPPGNPGVQVWVSP